MKSWGFAEHMNQAVCCLLLPADEHLYASEFGLRLAYLVAGHLGKRRWERRLTAFTPSDLRRLPEAKSLAR